MKKSDTTICLLSIILTLTACGAKSNSPSVVSKPNTLQNEPKPLDEAPNDNTTSCKNRIFFLPQTHPNILGGTLEIAPENFNETAHSQFAIAKYLEKYQNVPVFSEQVSTDQTVGTVSSDFKQAAAGIKSMFPNGLPENFKNLTEQQLNIIARAGGDAISFILRNTERLHRVVENDEIQDELIGQVSAWAKKNPNAPSAPPMMSRHSGRLLARGHNQKNKWLNKTAIRCVFRSRRPPISELIRQGISEYGAHPFGAKRRGSVLLIA